ncbi:MAG: acyl-CoA thioesterase [Armatimonadetes bacterium]|nr:acyl-CoA thioesterase [Armatimonadota bacterium]
MENDNSTDGRSPEVRMSELMMPEHANFLGQVFGGSILALLDKVAYVTASRYAGMICVTVSIDRVDFHSPIEVGELVHLTGRVIYVGRTSVQVRIEVHAENIHAGTVRHTNSCSATLVAIDDDRKPTPVPRLRCDTREEKLGFLQGRLRREMAQKYKDEFRRGEGRLAALTDEELNSYISDGRAII